MSFPFSDGLKWDFSSFIKEVEGAAYLPYPVVMAAAQAWPNVVPDENGRLYHSIFGGAVVTVELDGQRVSLPVLDRKNKPVPVETVNSRDVSDTIVRAKTKAIAVMRGYGLALYAGDLRPLNFIKGLGVKPDSDLRTVQPRVRQKEYKKRPGPPYVKWADALAAAKLTDPSFRWEVVTFNEADEDGVIRLLPYTRAGVGAIVGVKVRYRKQEYTEYLAIMGTREVQTKNGVKELDNQPLPNPTSHDWHRAVMRCLTKAIALATGYGLSVYAKEDLADLEMRFLGAGRTTEKLAPTGDGAATATPTTAAQTAEGAGQAASGSDAAAEASQKADGKAPDSNSGPVNVGAAPAAPAEAAQTAAETSAQQTSAQPADSSGTAPEVTTGVDTFTSENESAALLAALREETASMTPQMLERVLRGVVTRGWVAAQPASVEALVAEHPDAARKLLDALQAKRKQ